MGHSGTLGQATGYAFDGPAGGAGPGLAVREGRDVGLKGLDGSHRIYALDATATRDWTGRRCPWGLLGEEVD